MERFSKRRRIPELKEGERIDDIFFVKFKKRIAPYENGFFFELTLSDGSGRNIDYRYWGDKEEAKVRALYESIKPDSIVHVQGKVVRYKERLQIGTSAPDKIEVLEPGQYEEKDFIKQARRDSDEAYAKLLEFVEEVKDPKLKELLDAFFGDDGAKDKIKKQPGAIDIHHNWIGGLMDHIIEVAEYCKKSCELYPQLDKDLVIAGALLHDIGKLEELELTSRIRGTRRGQLLGHLALSAMLVAKKCDEVGVDADKKDKLLHIIISHHGKSEQGSPKEPMFPEALVVYYADELSARLSEMIEFIEESKSATEDDFMFSKRYERNVLLR